MAHTVYILLWLLAVLNLAFGGTLMSIFAEITPLVDFGEIGTPLFRWGLFSFSLITILAHQLFIYQSLHEMEHKKEQWISNYPNWFNTILERLLRWTIFIVLLAGVGKIPGLENICHQFFSTSICNPQQKMIVLGSCILFFLLTTWNLFAGGCSKKWDYFWSDFLALLFWSIIAYITLGGSSSIGYFAIIPLVIFIFYTYVIGKRIFNLLKTIRKFNG